MASSRCTGGVCSCHSGDKAEESPVPSGAKRFELQIGRGLDPTTVLIDGRVALDRPSDHPEAVCSDIELPPGRHTVELRARAKEPVAGFTPQLALAEYGPVAAGWYHTFDFACGGAEACTKDDLRDWLEKVQAVPRGLHDPCGSVRVEQVHWGAERSPEVKLEDLQLSFVLHVYAFTPKNRSGAPNCPDRDQTK
jgi:hypothetical protein